MEVKLGNILVVKTILKLRWLFRNQGLRIDAEVRKKLLTFVGYCLSLVVEEGFVYLFIRWIFLDLHRATLAYGTEAASELVPTWTLGLVVRTSILTINVLHWQI